MKTKAQDNDGRNDGEGIPRWAEVYFHHRVIAIKATVATEPDSDINGRDFHVELKRKPCNGAAASTPPADVAYVQVKSTVGRRLQARIKLSNMLKACQSPNPWFIVLITARKDGSNPQLYARHVWGPVLRESLAAIRRADVDQIPLHSQKFTLALQESDKIDGSAAE